MWCAIMKVVTVIVYTLALQHHCAPAHKLYTCKTGFPHPNIDNKCLFLASLSNRHPCVVLSTYHQSEGQLFRYTACLCVWPSAGAAFLLPSTTLCLYHVLSRIFPQFPSVSTVFLQLLSLRPPAWATWLLIFFESTVPRNCAQPFSWLSSIIGTSGARPSHLEHRLPYLCE